MELSLPNVTASPSEKLKDVADCSATPKTKTKKREVKTCSSFPGKTKKRRVKIDSDLVKLLSSPERVVFDGIDCIEHLDGKVAVFISMWLPMSDKLAMDWRNLIETYHAFRKEHNNQVEFVFAPIMHPKHNSPTLLHEFSSSLPFHTVPFIYEEARHSVAKHSRLSTCSDNGDISAIAFDRDGKEVDFPSGLVYLLQSYGTDCYPFTKEHLDSLSMASFKFNTIEGPFSLQSVLRCSSDTTDLGLTKLDGTPVSHSASTLRKNVVGIYLCAQGDFLEKLVKVHQACKSEGNNFVIVLLYVPFVRPIGEDLGSFLNRINDKLSLLNVNDEDWFVFPFDDSRSDKVSRRFWQMYSHFHFDELAMVGPDGEYFDPDAREMIRHYGHKAFPFTKGRVKEVLLQDIESLTLNDFVPSAILTRLDPDRDHLEVVSLSNVLENKETTFVLHCYEKNPKSLNSYFILLNKWYESIKQRDCADQFEVIVVCLVDSTFDAFVSKLPWLVGRCNEDDAATTRNKIKKLGVYVGCIVAFHKGKVISLSAVDCLSESNPIGFLTDDEDPLESEVSAMLDDRHSNTVQSFYQV